MKPKKKKQKIMRITEADFMLANRRAARLEEIAAHGRPVTFRKAVHKSKKVYDRKRLKDPVIGVVMFLLSAAGASAQNPVFISRAYNSDPQARVWTMDGKPTLFVYGSRDESPTYYCSGRYDVFSTEDMVHWKGGDSFSSEEVP